ncbi:MAG: glucans biosynthesis glucosyltransferase MdoH [Roseobacter sp.]
MSLQENHIILAEEMRPAVGADPQAKGFPSRATITRRRAFVAALNIVTVVVLTGVMILLLSYGGFIAIEWLMLIAYAITLPWMSIGLWNSLIGFAIDRKYGAQAATMVTPALGRAQGDEPITTRIAIVMPLRNEDPALSLERFQTLQTQFAATPWADQFTFHVLSDTDKPDIALQEETGIAAWRAGVPGAPLHYRRRTENTGYKAGNIAEFLDTHGQDYDFFLPLDADSVMGPDTILRMVRVLQASPEIGLLQSLITGLPSRTFFTRSLVFGMSHVMRSFTLGAAWWQADCGPNWGHNALIRTAPFHDHCMLAPLPGRGPLSGDILSHDQLEACLLRRAGYEIRVLAEESDSHEESPPSLADFLRREIRWCNGNLQYLRLLGLPQLETVSRLQLFMAIQAYVSAAAWMLFIALGAVLVTVDGQVGAVPLWASLGLFGAVMTLNLMPKFMGIGQVLADSKRAASWGGRARLITSGLAEILVSMLIAPVLAFGLTCFTIGLMFGRRVGWDAQQRSRARLEWSEAVQVFWPQTLAGLGLSAWLAVQAPWGLAFGAPILLPLILAIPIAVWTTQPGVSRLSLRLGLFDTPLDRREAVPPLPRASSALDPENA